MPLCLYSCCELFVPLSMCFTPFCSLTDAVAGVVQAALLAGRSNKALVGREEFSQAVLRSVAGIEKKRSILQGMEKDVVARHEVSVGHAGDMQTVFNLSQQ